MTADRRPPLDRRPVRDQRGRPGPRNAPQRTGGPAPQRTRRPATGRPTRRPTSVRRRILRVPLGSATRRLRIGLVVLAMAISLCAGRLLQLQGFDSSAYAAASTEQLTRTLALLPARGQITDRDGVVLASTEPAVNITADPTLTAKNAAAIAAVIYRYTGQAPEVSMVALTRPNTRFAYVAKKVPAETYTLIAQQLAHDKLPGVFRESNPIRTYPAGAVGAGVVGFVGADNEGLAGIEYSRNTQLAGVEGKESYESAPDGSKIPLGTSVVTPAKNGVSYQLSIDSELQWMAEQRLAAQVQKVKGDYGFAITMDVRTGQILALANAPGYDSSDPSAAGRNDIGRNRAVTESYEPGSVEKILTSAALIDSHTTTPDTEVKVPNRVPSGGGLIKDAEDHGTVHYRMRGIIAHSSNIGTLLMTRQLPKATLVKYLSSFGLGQKTGIELPAEAAGSIPSADMPDYTRDQIAFGQGLAVNGVQEAAAIAGIINGGVYHAPTVIASATSPDGTPADLNRPAPRRVVSAQTSAEVRGLMQAVVYGIKSRGDALSLDHYQTGGKTGTAQRAVRGGYHGYVTSYVDFAPLNDPSILTYVVINNPKKGGASGTSTAAPAVKDIMNYALPRYGVVPDQTSWAAENAKYKLPLTW